MCCISKMRETIQKVLFGGVCALVIFVMTFNRNLQYPTLNLSNVYHRMNGRVVMASCSSFLARNITDTNLIQFYKRCTNRIRKPKNVSVGPEMFDKIFAENNFRSVVCQNRNKTYISGQEMIALTSIPGSGNTWTRLLLEDLTGIYTGSMYFDSMALRVLRGSRDCPVNKELIVKTHEAHDTLNRKSCNGTLLHAFKKAIYILRNPYNAIIAEFNREQAGKINTTTKENFQSKGWIEMVHKYGHRYIKHLNFWLKEFEYPVHVLVYEDLQRNTLWELYKISKFIDFPVTFQTLWCIKARKDASIAFLRKKPDWLNAKNVYTEDLKNIIQTAIKQVINNVGKKYNLEETLSSYIL